MDIRKVQLTGGNSFVVCLPKSWVRTVGLKQKDAVALIPQADLSLLIVPRQDLKSDVRTEATVEVARDIDRDTIVRLFISQYLAGYDMIRLRSSTYDPGLRAFVREAIRRKLIGVEIIEESPNGISTQCLSGYTDLPLKRALERMSIIASGMITEAVQVLSDGSKALADEVAERDDEVDRFYHFIVRQLNIAVRNRSIIEEIGLTSARDCLGYRLAVKSVERVGDHAASIAKLGPTLAGRISARTLDGVKRMSSLSRKVFEDSVNALLRLDAKLANASISSTKAVLELEDKISKEVLAPRMDANTVASLKLTLESVRRVAEYGSDVAEISIDLTVKEP